MSSEQKKYESAFNCQCKKNIPDLLKPNQILLDKTTLVNINVLSALSIVASTALARTIVDVLCDNTTAIRDFILENRFLTILAATGFVASSHYHTHLYLINKMSKLNQLRHYSNDGYPYSCESSIQNSEWLTGAIAIPVGIMHGTILGPAKLIKGSISLITNKLNDLNTFLCGTSNQSNILSID